MIKTKFLLDQDKLLAVFVLPQHHLGRITRKNAKQKTDIGLIYFGSTSPAVEEAIDYLFDEGYNIDRIRIRSFPFDKNLKKFINDHEHVFILEQNRDAQMKFLISNELEIDINHFVSLLNFDGSPVTAKFIVDEFKLKVMDNKKIHSKIKKSKSAA